MLSVVDGSARNIELSRQFGNRQRRSSNLENVGSRELCPAMTLPMGDDPVATNVRIQDVLPLSAGVEMDRIAARRNVFPVFPVNTTTVQHENVLFIQRANVDKVAHDMGLKAHIEIPRRNLARDLSVPFAIERPCPGPALTLWRRITGHVVAERSDGTETARSTSLAHDGNVTYLCNLRPAGEPR